jgi:hypothetical protein
MEPMCPDRFWGPPSLISNGYSYLYRAGPLLRSQQSFSYSINALPFTELEYMYLLPCLQDLALMPYPRSHKFQSTPSYCILYKYRL